MKNTTLERNAYIITVYEYKHKIYMSYERFTFIGQNPFKKFSNATKKDVPLEPMVFIVLSSLVGVRCATLIPPAALRFSLVITKINSKALTPVDLWLVHTVRDVDRERERERDRVRWISILCYVLFTLHRDRGQEWEWERGPMGCIPIHRWDQYLY